jgi:hypothetical protein
MSVYHIFKHRAVGTLQSRNKLIWIMPSIYPYYYEIFIELYALAFPERAKRFISLIRKENTF